MWSNYTPWQNFWEIELSDDMPAPPCGSRVIAANPSCQVPPPTNLLVFCLVRRQGVANPVPACHPPLTPSGALAHRRAGIVRRRLQRFGSHALRGRDHALFDRSEERSG
jgi:hypothetical protein